MQHGRMKGQAFIGMPSEETAGLALQETNGYKLHGRPMVVVSHVIHIEWLEHLNSFCLNSNLQDQQRLKISAEND